MVNISLAILVQTSIKHNNGESMASSKAYRQRFKHYGIFCISKIPSAAAHTPE
jgi:hypothetical protein